MRFLCNYVLIRKLSFPAILCGFIFARVAAPASLLTIGFRHLHYYAVHTAPAEINSLTVSLSFRLSGIATPASLLAIGF
jgi:hypothetical protein